LLENDPPAGYCIAIMTQKSKKRLPFLESAAIPISSLVWLITEPAACRDNKQQGCNTKSNQDIQVQAGGIHGREERHPGTTCGVTSRRTPE
jgi:hypothetical protein